MYAPFITPFVNLKKEAIKFIISQYRKGKLCLLELVEIMTHLIAAIMRMPATGDPVSSYARNPTLLEELTGTQSRKRSKGIRISQITNMTTRWEAIIISIYLKNFGKLFDVKI